MVSWSTGLKLGLGTGNKEFALMESDQIGDWSWVVFRKAQSWAHYFSWYLLMISNLMFWAPSTSLRTIPICLVEWLVWRTVWNCRRTHCANGQTDGSCLLTLKCKVLHLGGKNPCYSYTTNGHQLEELKSEKDLGVVISQDLKVFEQCQQAYTKANSMLGLLKRSITIKDRQVMLQLYKSLVRPHLEFCSSAWSPHYQKDKALLEKVQHRFTRLVTGLKSFVLQW